MNCITDKYGVALPGMKIYRCHIDKSSDDFSEVVGEVARNPNNPQCGVAHLGDIAWNVETADGIQNDERGRYALAAIKTITSRRNGGC